MNRGTCLGLPLLLLLELGEAWTVSPIGRKCSTATTKTSLVVCSLSDHNDAVSGGGEQLFGGDDDEEECHDLCDIDWDLMPDDDDDDEQEQEQEASVDKEEVTVADGDVSRRAMQLEMQWQIMEQEEDCETDQSQTCGMDYCKDCNGTGFSKCRFCHGKKYLFWQRGSIHDTTINKNQKNTVQECTICQSTGMELCKTCRGTGWIAPWAAMAGAMKDN